MRALIQTFFIFYCQHPRDSEILEKTEGEPISQDAPDTDSVNKLYLIFAFLKYLFITCACVDNNVKI